MGGQAGRDGGADRQRVPSALISVTLGHPAVTLLHAKQRASPAEGGRGRAPRGAERRKL